MDVAETTQHGITFLLPLLGIKKRGMGFRVLEAWPSRTCFPTNIGQRTLTFLIKRVMSVRMAAPSVMKLKVL